MPWEFVHRAAALLFLSAEIRVSSGVEDSFYEELQNVRVHPPTSHAPSHTCMTFTDVRNLVHHLKAMLGYTRISAAQATQVLCSDLWQYAPFFLRSLEDVRPLYTD